ncbi:phosphate acyltransferase PlsX [Calidifontimicrobium sp. SYSU G02091]|uniref:phosphate acyltransferase PlsX n=1 Tax=Calidifontimicrobium sp. SYSU G02091 TaxID=2926421 RepID=UPI001F532D5E|nr:phosphate acyltransferase PlsX [Calidifontimicrobium sp. SYSU G02091]MCI1190512.1 phosphate acyltransferase PlsX [Calidifontimicrobium sp. SYSU G02091]
MTAPLPALARVRMAVDCMGGDHGPAVTLPACRGFLDRHPDAELLLVGTEAALRDARGWPRTRVVVASEVVTMDDPVEVALRKKRDSSMRVAIAQLKSGDGAPPAADVCVSAGNTGALMAVARYLLKTVDGIDRPAIATVMPNRNDGYTTVLDLGANVDCTAEHLLQFAVLGSALVAAIDGKEEPSVGLLNIGEEAIKGSDTIKRAGELLRAAADGGHLNFHGNVEGNDIFRGTTDIVVCDGFVGNVALKTAEGLAAMLSDFIRQEFTRTAYAKFAALVALPVLKHFKSRVDHRRYNGAALLGLRGLVFKSHGSADAFAFEHALSRAYDAARNRLLDRVHDRILDTLQALPEPAAPALRTA